MAQKIAEFVPTLLDYPGAPICGPDALAMLSKAFDAAWNELAASFESSPDKGEAAREQLAKVLLSIDRLEMKSADELARASLQALQRINGKDLGPK